MNQLLQDHVQKRLREEKLITETEVALQFADKFVAENILTKQRRVIHVPSRLLEEGNTSKRILKG